MKNYRYVGILLVFVIMAAVSVAGCTSTGTTNATATPAATGTTAGTVTPAATTTSGSTLGSIVDYSKVKWYEYQMTSTSGGTPTTMKMREDFKVDYQGKTANKVTITMDSTSSGSTTSTEITTYMDTANSATLGGHMTMKTDGTVVMDQDIPASAAASTTPSTGSTQNPLQTYQDSSMTNSGTESVTVPAGTYTATKYTWTSGDATGSAWVASSVPLPVKITSSSSGTTMDMELTGWG